MFYSVELSIYVCNPLQRIWKRLAPTLFNVALEYVIRQKSIGKENLLTKTLQVAASTL